ncbi:hypothetical protein TSUD_312960 [Trifolium subterraneum]|uniref:Uncharacterized protein n=1 Tax=Trifolium subterraneum TaxID=3900 RepID=A0A2Z6NGC3_TRISU|nr:hypothetical protein TSUD_312960 [Trifolium subterraneum]
MSGIKKKQIRFRIPWISGSSVGFQSRPKQRSNSSSQLAYAPQQPPPTPISEPLERKMMFAIATSNPSENNIKVPVDPVTASVSNSPLQNSTMKDDATNFVNKVTTENPTTITKLPDDDKTVSVVTLAGDNRGATMHVADSHSQSTRKKGSIRNIHRTNEEEEKDEAGKAYVNSNIQSMNNSLMVQGSINGRDPGVRVILPQHPEPQVKRDLENRRDEVKTVSQVEKLTYRPMVRRRCLRGLMAEPSDSDPDKPRRHGCKFSCGDVKKDNEIL